MRGINLIPFYYNQETNTHLREVLYNIIVFIPLGAYVHIFKEDWKKVTKCIVVFWIPKKCISIINAFGGIIELVVIGLLLLLLGANS